MASTQKCQNTNQASADRVTAQATLPRREVLLVQRRLDRGAYHLEQLVCQGSCWRPDSHRLFIMGKGKIIMQRTDLVLKFQSHDSPLADI